jgi:hypothetical protein
MGSHYFRFLYLASNIAASHSSGLLSFNIPNLQLHLRYRLTNMIFSTILPGPTEHDPDEVQLFLRIIINELLQLWKDGIMVNTSKYPLGRLVRLILLCICCNKPAAHKVGGFASHSHRFFCT